MLIASVGHNDIDAKAAKLSFACKANGCMSLEEIAEKRSQACPLGAIDTKIYGVPAQIGDHLRYLPKPKSFVLVNIRNKLCRTGIGRTCHKTKKGPGQLSAQG